VQQPVLAQFSLLDEHWESPEFGGTGLGAGGDGVGIGDGDPDVPPTISVSMQDTKISSVYLQTHSHLNVTFPVGISLGKGTLCGKCWPDFQ